ncbi:alpha/beta hydrolase [Candidatus Uhrbacteria bacterium]|nr:alpha/beta hydrolase [Candidatus Uhrbacteria bacterium]
MKRVIIIHCWSGTPEYCWYPAVKKELEQRGFDVFVPAMPQTDAPKLSLWLPELQSIIGKPDEETFLIGHSIGCATIMRYLESLPEGEMVGGAMLVAGYTDDLGFEELSNFFETPFDFEAMKKHCATFVAIHSDNDPFVPPRHSDILKEKLGAKTIIKHNAGHFSGAVDNEAACTDLPDVVNSVLAMAH